jgi:hypothetical protein
MQIILLRVRVCMTNKAGFGFNDRIYWTFIQLLTTFHKSRDSDLSIGPCVGCVAVFPPMSSGNFPFCTYNVARALFRRAVFLYQRRAVVCRRPPSQQSHSWLQVRLGPWSYYDMTPESRRSLVGNDSVNIFPRQQIRKQQSSNFHCYATAL